MQRDLRVHVLRSGQVDRLLQHRFADRQHQYLVISEEVVLEGFAETEPMKLRPKRGFIVHRRQHHRTVVCLLARVV